MALASALKLFKIPLFIRICGIITRPSSWVMHVTPTPGPMSRNTNLCPYSMFISFPSRNEFVTSRPAGLLGQFSLAHSQWMVD